MSPPVLTLRVTPELHREFIELARRNDRSASAEVRIAMRQRLAAVREASTPGASDEGSDEITLAYRPPVMTEEKLHIAREMIATGCTVTEIAKMIGVSERTLRRSLSQAAS